MNVAFVFSFTCPYEVIRLCLPAEFKTKMTIDHTNIPYSSKGKALNTHPCILSDVGRQHINKSKVTFCFLSSDRIGH